MSSDSMKSMVYTPNQLPRAVRSPSSPSGATDHAGTAARPSTGRASAHYAQPLGRDLLKPLLKVLAIHHGEHLDVRLDFSEERLGQRGQLRRILKVEDDE